MLSCCPNAFLCTNYRCETDLSSSLFPPKKPKIKKLANFFFPSKSPSQPSNTNEVLLLLPCDVCRACSCCACSCVVLYCCVSCSIELCCAVLSCGFLALCCVQLCCAVLCVLCCAVLCCVAWRCVILAVLYCVCAMLLLRNVVLCCPTLCCVSSLV